MKYLLDILAAQNATKLLEVKIEGSKKIAFHMTYLWQFFEDLQPQPLAVLQSKELI